MGEVVKSRKPLVNLGLKLLERNQPVDLQPNGEFGIRNLQPGDYTLEITADGRKTTKHKLTVPARSYDVEL